MIQTDMRFSVFLAQAMSILAARAAMKFSQKEFIPGDL
jgi:hypothetical protein